MITIGEFSGIDCIIEDARVTLDSVEWSGVSDLAALGITDDAGGAEVLAARLRGVRQRRDELLATCDWTQLPDAPVSDEMRTAWRTYRQALRDLPETITDPLVPVSWPALPAEQ